MPSSCKASSEVHGHGAAQHVSALLSGSSELYHNRVNHTPDAKDRLSQLVCLADLQHHASKTLTGLRLHT